MDELLWVLEEDPPRIPEIQILQTLTDSDFPSLRHVLVPPFSPGNAHAS
jgi:hypothetical protein